MKNHKIKHPSSFKPAWVLDLVDDAFFDNTDPELILKAMGKYYVAFVINYQFSGHYDSKSPKVHRMLVIRIRMYYNDSGL